MATESSDSKNSKELFVVIAYRQYKTIKDFLYVDSIWTDEKRVNHYVEKRLEDSHLESEDTRIVFEIHRQSIIA